MKLLHESFQFLQGFFDFLRIGKKNRQLAQNLLELSKLLEYKFHDDKVLMQALKHRSYLTVTGENRIASNERLELLGDAVLGLVVTQYLFENFLKEDEGGLTSLKSLLVSRKSLAHVGNQIGLGKYLLLSDAEANSGGRSRSSILADAVEAIIGAIYLDGGLDESNKFIRTHIIAHLETFSNLGQLKNYKSILLEYCQSKNLNGPIYLIQAETGPDHDKTFVISSIIEGKKLGQGVGNTKKVAEQKAAKQALNALNLL